MVGKTPSGRLRVEFRPGLVQAAEIELGGDLLADGVLHIREVQHHAVGIEPAAHGHDQLVVVAMARGHAAGAELCGVLLRGQLRQPIAVAGTERGPARDHAWASLAVGCIGDDGHRARRRRRHHWRSHDSE